MNPDFHGGRVGRGKQHEGGRKRYDELFHQKFLCVLKHNPLHVRGVTRRAAGYREERAGIRDGAGIRERMLSDA